MNAPRDSRNRIVSKSKFKRAALAQKNFQNKRIKLDVEKNENDAGVNENEELENKPEPELENNQNIKDYQHLDGIRFCDISYLGEQMWCYDCDLPLSFRFITREKRRGLASAISIRCFKCLDEKLIHISEKSNNAENSVSLYSINYKAAIGCMHTGIGHEQLRKFFVTIDLPPPTNDTLKFHQDKLSEVVIEAAHDSCVEAIREEKRLTLLAQESVPLVNPVCSSEVDILVNCEESETQREEEKEESVSLEKITSVSKCMENPVINEPSPPISNSEANKCNDDKPVEPSPPISNSEANKCNNDKSVEPSPPISNSEANKCNNDKPVALEGSYDFAWFKRGNGKSYDSKNGQGNLIGVKSKKVLGYKYISNYCAESKSKPKPNSKSETKKSKKKPVQHVCNKNFCGSSKAMEPFAAVEIIAKNKDLKNENAQIGTLCGDDDSCTISAVQRESNHKVNKVSDLNHLSKNFSGKLYKMKKHKLSAGVIKYLKYCFNSAIKKNKNNPTNVKNALLNISEHVFGNHDGCGKWCGYSKDPVNYKFKSLPGGKPLDDLAFKKDLEIILKNYADRSEQIAPCGSSQSNESFNHMVVSKAPKSRFYGGSNSGHVRVSCAVLEKNVGAGYIVELNRKAKLPLGNVTQNYTKRMEALKRKKNDRAASITYKYKRLLSKKKGNQSKATLEKKEGLNYQTNMGIDNVSSLSPQVPFPSYNLQQENPSPESVLILCDIETTGLQRDANIIQISAICKEKEFERYIMPRKNIPEEVTQITGLQVVNGEMQYFGDTVQTTSNSQAAQDFVHFLRSFEKPVVLVGHNFNRFDSPRIIKWLEETGFFSDFQKIVYGICDTLSLIGKGEESKKQDVLAEKFLKGTKFEHLLKGSHNALIDCKILEALLLHFNINEKILLQNSIGYFYMAKQKAEKLEIKNNKLQLKELQSVLSKPMITKLAKAKLSTDFLCKAYSSGGSESIKLIFGESINGKPRITTNKKIIQSVLDFLEKRNTE